MLQKIKKKLFFMKAELLIKNGILKGQIQEFDEKFYERLSHTYFSGIPISFHIKYFFPKEEEGRCYDRSLYMFLAIEEAILVRGSRKDLEYLYGKESSGHGWIEIGDYVYDPTSRMKFSKSLYYQIYEPSNVYKTTRKEYCSNEESRKFLQNIVFTTLNDLKPGGRKRQDLLVIPLIREVIRMKGETETLEKLDSYLEKIQYNEETIFTELTDISQLIKTKNFS